MKYYRVIEDKFNGVYDSKVNTNLSFATEDGFFELGVDEFKRIMKFENIVYVDGRLENHIKTRQDYINEGIITLESEKEKARVQREKEYAAYHKLINNIFMGIEEELTEDERANVLVWHKAWKDVPNNYTNINISIEDNYPKRPDRINYYYN